MCGIRNDRRAKAAALTAAAVVALAGTASAQISENFESSTAGTLPAGWSAANTGTGLPWAVISDQSHSVPNAVFTNDVAASSQQLLMMPSFTAASSGPLYIDLWRRFATELTFDGWTIEASINGGPFANIGNAAWIANGYNLAAVSTANIYLGSQPAFSGSFLTWTRSIASINVNAGDTVALRVNMASDPSVGSTGVWLDDVSVSQTAPTGTCCAADGTCAVATQAACAGSGGTFNAATDCASAACPQPGACCNLDGTCGVSLLSACNTAGGIFRGAGTSCASQTCATGFGEVEPNETKAGATPITFASAGQYIRGNSTGANATAGSASLDQFLVRTPAMPLGLYRNRLTITTGGTAGHTGSIRGLNQTAATAGTWPGAVGVAGTTDSAVQTSSTATTPARMNQWYGFGRQEQVYYRVTGATTTPDNYAATLSVDPVTVTDLGGFATGQITLSTVGQGHTTDTDLWVYDGNFNAVDGFGNDGSSINGGAAANNSTPSFLRRDFAPGTYYLALSNANLSNNKGSPCDDNLRTGLMMDFPDVVANSSTTGSINVAFAVTDSAGTSPFAATRPSAYDVLWFRFVVGGAPAIGACCNPDGSCNAGLTSAQCAAQGGSFAGANSTCATANCPQPGACCRNDGTCSMTAAAACVSVGNTVATFSGSGVSCGSAQCARYTVVSTVAGSYTDISTTGTAFTTLASGSADDGTYAFTSSVTNALVSSPNLFVGTNGNISNLGTFTGFTNTTLPTTPTTGLTLLIAGMWDDLNNTSSPSRILHEARNENGVPVEIIQWDNTIHFGQTAAGSFQIKIWGPGGPALVQYLYPDLAWNWNGNSATVGIQWDASHAYQWSFATGTGPATPPGPIADNSVLSVVAPNTCYANCDGSTLPPVANVADFTCFLQKFAANDPYANCDGSTLPPTINVADFTCFLQKFAAGCP